MSEHTKGPWSAVDNSWDTSTVYGHGGVTVAECPIDAECDEDTQDQYEAVKEANARLIAAAPDVLTELKKARDRLNAWLVTAGMGDEGRKGELASIDAAIAKATS